MKEHKLTLDKERSLKYSNRSFFKFEELTGKSVLAIFAEIQNLPESEQNAALLARFSSPKLLTNFIYCGLLHDGVKYDDVVDMIPVSEYMNIMQFVMQVITDEFAMDAGGKKKGVAVHQG